MTAAEIEIDTDIPCGRAKRIQRLGADHVRFRMPADGSYMAYWCVRLRARTAGTCRLEVLPDPDYTGPLLDGVPRSYKHRMGSGIAIARGAQWTRVAADGEMHEPEGLAAAWLPARIELSVRLDQGERVILSNTIPWPHAEACRFLRHLAAAAAGRATLVDIGRSVEGREILGLDFRGREGSPAILVVSGEHATEFAGQHAVRGIAEFLASEDPRAGWLRKTFRILLAPQANPDGNVHALLHQNAHGADVCESYLGAGSADAGPCPEARAILHWADAAKPSLVLNFHGWTWTYGNAPHHFVLRVSPPRHPSAAGRARQQAVDRAILERTQGASRAGHLQESRGQGCLHGAVAAQR